MRVAVVAVRLFIEERMNYLLLLEEAAELLGTRLGLMDKWELMALLGEVLEVALVAQAEMAALGHMDLQVEVGSLLEELELGRPTMVAGHRYVQVRPRVLVQPTTPLALMHLVDKALRMSLLVKVDLAAVQAGMATTAFLVVAVAVTLEVGVVALLGLLVVAADRLLMLQWEALAALAE